MTAIGDEGNQIRRMKNKSFINNDFLLQNQFAKDLYENYASQLPIIDYHCHLSPKEIAQDRKYENITQLWIHGDHYKWRAMRTLGVEEKYITGDATDKEKFMAWARVVPYTLRNPLFQWTHLELKRYFGIDEMLNETSAERLYEEINSKLQEPGFSCKGLLRKMNIKLICTTEDPTDPLEYHKQIRDSDFEIQISTSFRPDKAIMIEANSFRNYIQSLGDSADVSIDSFQKLCDALTSRINYFHENGCRLSDHGLDQISFETFSSSEIEGIFKRKLAGDTLSELDIEKFKAAILLFLGEKYEEKGWVQQFHLGALRNTNKRMLERLGPDTGWDSISDLPQAEKLSKYLDALDGKNKLARTILYNLNPSDNEVFASMAGNFNDGSVKGKVQFGAAWWFLDQKDGIIKQLNALSNMGMISSFIGMLTDSRSFLSYPRHEYFRRVLCNLFGEEMASGELPDDIDLVGTIIADISYYNAREYFNL